MLSSYKKVFSGVFLLLLGMALYLGLQPRKCGAHLCAIDYSPVTTYGVAGGHAVGQRTLTTASDPPLSLQLWYPAAADQLTPTASYPYQIKIGAPVGTVTLAETPSQALPDAPLHLAEAPYPLIVLSPGFALGATTYGWLAEHLASYGFVVIAPEHKETLDPQNELWRAAVTRPLDIQAVLAYVDTAAGAGGELESLIDPQTTAVIGHSYGGYTALATAGARIDTASFESHCAAAREAEETAVWLCDMLLSHLDDMAELAGLDGVPEGLWPNWGDSRIDAVISMAGDAYFFGQTGLATVDVPVLAVGGTADDDTPFHWGPQPAYDHTTSQRKALFALNDAEHMIFTNPCPSIRWYGRPLADEFCADTVWNRYQAQDVVRHMTTAFLLAELKQDPAAAAALNMDNIQFPNVAYQAEGYE